MLSQALNAGSLPPPITLKLWRSFFLSFGSPAARLVRLHGALSFFFPPLFPHHTSWFISLCFFFFYGLLVVMFFCLKAGTTEAKQYAMFECVLTPRLHKAWFPGGGGGRMSVWHVYILFPFLCCIKKKKKITLSLFCFPPSCKLDACWGKTDVDPSLTPKEEVADKQALPWETTEKPQPTHGSAQATPCAFRSIISIHRPPVYYTNMFFTCTDARRFRCFNMFTRSERLKGRKKFHLRGPFTASPQGWLWR